MCISDNLQLKKEFDIVKELQNLLGFGWDNAMKHVLPAVWDECLKVCLTHIYAGLTCPSHSPPPLSPFQSHNKVKLFHRKGFPLFNKIGNLIDSTCATGEFMFWAGQNSGPSNTWHSSPATPSEDNIESQINPILLDISKDTTLTHRPHTPYHWEDDK